MRNVESYGMLKWVVHNNITPMDVILILKSVVYLVIYCYYGANKAVIKLVTISLRKYIKWSKNVKIMKKEYGVKSQMSFCVRIITFDGTAWT